MEIGMAHAAHEIRSINFLEKNLVQCPWEKILIVLCLGFVFMTAASWTSLMLRPTLTIQLSSSIELPRLDVEVAELIRKIKHATSIAGGGSGDLFSETEIEAWDSENPCRSRSQLNSWHGRRKHAKDISPNAQWDLVFREYGKLHRTCMEKVRSLSEYLVTGNTSTGCKFLVGEAHYGLGNKLLHLSSAFMFAVLSQRVFLLPRSTVVAEIVCEPFVGSSWIVEDILLQELWNRRVNSLELYKAMAGENAKNEAFEVTVARVDDTWQPMPSFWCDTEQKLLSKVTWLTIDGCLYFLPKLFAIPAFQRTMEALFPERVILPYVLRSIMLPRDPVWERIVKLSQAYLQNADEQIGIQIRFLGRPSAWTYPLDIDLVNTRVADCLLENGFLPRDCKDPSNLTTCTRSPSPQRQVRIVVTSLTLETHDYLLELFLRQDTPTSAAVSLVQFSHKNWQSSGVQEDRDALIEMIALSFSDILLITPFSTFGHLAGAYGNLRPWFINSELRGPFIDSNISNAQLSCLRAVSREPCYIDGTSTPDCRYDSPDHRSNVFDRLPYLTTCMRIEHEGGVMIWSEEERPISPQNVQLGPNRNYDPRFNYVNVLPPL